MLVTVGDDELYETSELCFNPLASVYKTEMNDFLGTQLTTAKGSKMLVCCEILCMCLWWNFMSSNHYPTVQYYVCLTN